MKRSEAKLKVRTLKGHDDPIRINIPKQRAIRRAHRGQLGHGLKLDFHSARKFLDAGYIAGALEHLLNIDESRAAEHLSNQVARAREVLQPRHSGQVGIEAHVLT